MFFLHVRAVGWPRPNCGWSSRILHWRVSRVSMVGKSRTEHQLVDKSSIKATHGERHARDLFLRHRSHAALTRVGNGICSFIIAKLTCDSLPMLFRSDLKCQAGLRNTDDSRLLPQLRECIRARHRSASSEDDGSSGSISLGRFRAFIAARRSNSRHQ